MNLEELLKCVQTQAGGLAAGLRLAAAAVAGDDHQEQHVRAHRAAWLLRFASKAEEARSYVWGLRLSVDAALVAQQRANAYLPPEPALTAEPRERPGRDGP